VGLKPVKLVVTVSAALLLLMDRTCTAQSAFFAA
jgi:hypothetical protein